MVFEGSNVIIELINGEPMFEIYSVGVALGQSKKNSQGVLYPRKERIVENLKNAEVSTCVHNGHEFITESQLYDFMLEAKTEKCKSFRKWVTNDVLPRIRAEGHYTLNNDNAKVNAVSSGITGITSSATLELMQTLLNEQRLLLEQNEQLKIENVEMKPKAEGYDELIDSKGDLDFKQLVKSIDGLTVGRNLFMGILRDKKILMSDNTPYQEYASRGYFRVIQVTNGFHSNPKTLVTKKGLDWLIKKCQEWELI